jgi:hypothetical protein
MEIQRFHFRAVRFLKRVFLSQEDPRLEMLERMPMNSVCAEIGVWRGDFSRIILKRTSPKRLHLIDPWTFQPEFPARKYGGHHAKKQEDMDKVFRGVESRFEDVENVSIHRARSEEAMAEFPDGYFDWIYLDGNHEFEFVLKDLTMGFAKVRSGGFIAGDDYGWGKKRGFPVERAVQEFVRLHSVEDHLEIFGSQYIIRRP